MAKRAGGGVWDVAFPAPITAIMCGLAFVVGYRFCVLVFDVFVCERGRMRGT